MHRHLPLTLKWGSLSVLRQHQSLAVTDDGCVSQRAERKNGEIIKRQGMGYEGEGGRCQAAPRVWAGEASSLPD